MITLFLQIILILSLVQFLGSLFRKFHQPQVVGEMLAGILLGPSFLGYFFPDLFNKLFPPTSFETLHILSQLGLIVFMFLVGLDLNLPALKIYNKSMVFIGILGVICPLIIGITFSFYLYPKFADNVKFINFALFIGTAMSVTAFPVLSRILVEHDLLGSKIGAISLGCAAVADVVAWCLLAIVVALARTTTLYHTLTTTVLGTIIYIAIIPFVIKPILRKVKDNFNKNNLLNRTNLAIIFIILLISSTTTEYLGIHALFGAFIIGAAMPKEINFITALEEKLTDFTVVFMLPLFFVYTGLRTQINVINNWNLLFDSMLIIIVATIGKFGATTLLAKATGLKWRQASAIGILMNTRGLMEIVILTVGLELHIISRTVFVMMVIMAIFTTLITTPILEKLYPLDMMRQDSISPDVIS